MFAGFYPANIKVLNQSRARPAASLAISFA